MAEKTRDPEVIVVGAGVSGLSTAVLLQEQGLQTHVVSAARPHATTSAVAAAVWYPYRAYPEDLVVGWGRRTYEELARLASDPAAGIRMIDGVELHREPQEAPWWREAVPDVSDNVPEQFRDRFIAATVFRAPVADMSIYLGYLFSRFLDAGGTFEVTQLENLSDVTTRSRVVVNCSGLGARTLAGDTTVFPIRGQVVRVSNPGLEAFVLDDHNPEGQTYIVPRFSDCILGGTSEEDDWDTTPNPATADAIFRRCIELEPRLEGCEVLEHRVGLRPGRAAIRLEREREAGGVVIHNYGHGGAGITLSWGCAAEAVALALEEIQAAAC